MWNMPEPTIEVSPLALSILQLLDERPMHPYELAATMRERHQDEFIRLNFGSLYHTVDVLERNGWIVTAEREKEGNRPERTIYRLTPTGREVLVDVVADILAQPRREYPHFAAGLLVLDPLTAEQTSGHLRARATALAAKVAKLSRINQELKAHGLKRRGRIEIGQETRTL